LIFDTDGKVLTPDGSCAHTRAGANDMLCFPHFSCNHRKLIV